MWCSNCPIFDTCEDPAKLGGADSEIEEDVRRMLGADDNGKEVRRGE